MRIDEKAAREEKNLHDTGMNQRALLETRLILPEGEEKRILLMLRSTKRGEKSEKHDSQCNPLREIMTAEESRDVRCSGVDYCSKTEQ